MAEPLKNIYSTVFIDIFSDILSNTIKEFKKEQFITEIFDSEWENRELKQRMWHISKVLTNHVSPEYPKAIQQLISVTQSFHDDKRAKQVKYGDLALIFIPDFIEQNGVEYFDVSVSAMETITQYSSCEFAVRPFILKYKEAMTDVMLNWAKHSNEHVRRLASEGCRPRLPWAMALPYFKIDPTPIIPILETLQNDPSEYVRRSVANNLNDIAKDNPELVISIAKEWIGNNDDTNSIVKHACRTLLKDGNKTVMQLFGFGSTEDLKIENLCLDSSTIHIGDDLKFQFDLKNYSQKEEKLRLEYGIYYRKKNDSLSRKVFKISEKVYPALSTNEITRSQHFKEISTRKYHAGLHKVSIIVNGEELAECSFKLIT